MTGMEPLFDPDASFRDIATIALDLHGHNSEAATAWAVEQARNNPDWTNARIESLIVRRMTDAVTHELKDRRKAIRGDHASIMQYPIWGGKHLGSATFAEIEEAAHRFIRDAKTREKKGHFLLAISRLGKSEGREMTDLGAVRELDKRSVESVFASFFGDGWIQDDLPFADE